MDYYSYANACFNINNEMGILMFYHALSHARAINVYCYNHFAISSKTCATVPALYWTPLAKLSRESAFTRRYRLRFRPQTPSSRTISALNSANVDSFPRLRYVKPRIVCKRNDVAFADEFVPLIHPFPFQWTNPGWSTR